MTGNAFEELVHRINNLLGTIEMQAEVARGGSIDAYDDALRCIVESARRVREDVQRLRTQVRPGGQARGAAPD